MLVYLQRFDAPRSSRARWARSCCTEELARMLGGARISTSARVHARQLIEEAASERKPQRCRVGEQALQTRIAVLLPPWVSSSVRPRVLASLTLRNGRRTMRARATLPNACSKAAAPLFSRAWGYHHRVASGLRCSLRLRRVFPRRAFSCGCWRVLETENLPNARVLRV